jgi:hypothetical protein
MRYGSVAIMAAVAVLVLGAVSAEAHSTSIPTTVNIIAIQGSPPDQLVTGTVDSRRERCESRRRVRFYIRRGSGPRELLDVSRTSRNGAFASRGNTAGADKLIVAVRKNVVGRGNHRHLCEPAKASRQL